MTDEQNNIRRDCEIHPRCNLSLSGKVYAILYIILTTYNGVQDRYTTCNIGIFACAPMEWEGGIRWQDLFPTKIYALTSTRRRVIRVTKVFQDEIIRRSRW